MQLKGGMVRGVVIIGSGVTGSALGAELSRAADGDVTVLERGLEGRR
jgi:choline dehydrogenase-like flavoprotein